MSDDDKELPWLEPAVEYPAESGFLEHYRMAIIAAGIFVIVAFALIIWQVYAGNSGQPGGEVPLVKAEDGPVKVKPEEPGGMEIPDRDKLIYGRVAGEQDNGEQPHLRPGPETPLDKSQLEAAQPAAPAPAPAPAPVAQAQAPQPALPQVQVAQVQVPPSRLPADPAADAKKSVPLSVASAPGTLQKPAAEKSAAPQKAAVEKPVVLHKAPAEKPMPVANAAEKIAVKTAPATSGDYLIQLGAFSDKAKAMAVWHQAQAKFPAVLSKLQPDVLAVDHGDKGVLYRLQAGKLASRESADDICKTLNAKAQACMVVHH